MATIHFSVKEIASRTNGINDVLALAKAMQQAGIAEPINIFFEFQNASDMQKWAEMMLVLPTFSDLKQLDARYTFLKQFFSENGDLSNKAEAIAQLDRKEKEYQAKLTDLETEISSLNNKKTKLLAQVSALESLAQPEP